MIRRILLRIGDFVFVTRPLILIPVWSFFLMGLRWGRRDPSWPVDPDAAVWGFVCLSAIMVTAYLINQVFDQESDRRNNKGHYLTSGVLGVRTVILMALLAFAGASLSFQNTAGAQRAPLVASLVLALVYSLPPIRLCARPIVDLVANAVGYGGLAFLVGAFAAGAAPGPALAQSLPWVLLVGATFLHTTILDVDGDRAAGKVTTSVFIGERASALWALALAFASLALALGVSLWRYGDVLPALAVAASLPAFVTAARAWYRGGQRRMALSSATVQYATLVVAVAAAFVEIRYLVLVVPIVIAARYYYRARFGVVYPGR